MKSIQELAKWTREANRIVVLSGAGLSTSSGIQDFRSSQGLYAEGHRERLLSVHYYNRNPEAFWQSFKSIFQQKLAGDFEPNAGHRFFAQLEQMGKRVDIFTQNVDGLHQKAGSKYVYEVHGSIKKAYCKRCGSMYDLNYINQTPTPYCRKISEKQKVCNTYLPITESSRSEIDCEACGTHHVLDGVDWEGIRCKGLKTHVDRCRRVLKPDVVLFGDNIRYFEEAKIAVYDTDLFIVIGSSLAVAPVNQLPKLAASWTDGNRKKVLINNESTDMDQYFDLVIQADIVDTVNQVATLL